MLDFCRRQFLPSIEVLDETPGSSHFARLLRGGEECGLTLECLLEQLDVPLLAAAPGGAEAARLSNFIGNYVIEQQASHCNFEVSE